MNVWPYLLPQAMFTAEQAAADFVVKKRCAFFQKELIWGPQALVMAEQAAAGVLLCFSVNQKTTALFFLMFNWCKIFVNFWSLLGNIW